MEPSMPGIVDVTLGTGVELQLPRRIRHISCIQVHNFTPFPVRDAVTSALSQPVEQSQLDALFHLSDDLDMSTRKRTRKASATSFSGKSSSRQDDEDSAFLEPRGRKISLTQKSSKNGTMGSSTSPAGLPRIPYGSPQTVRRRGRTGSVASSMSIQPKVPNPYGSVQGVPIAAAGSFAMLLPDISQQGLEKVIDSRLVETFLTTTILPALPEASTNATAAMAKTPFREGTNNRKAGSTRRAYNIPTPTSSLPVGTPTEDKATNGIAAKPLTLRLKAGHVRSPSASQQNGVGVQVPSSPHSFPRDFPPQHFPESYPIPDYFSSIHRPSVNPTFPIDARLGRDFSPSSDMTSNRLKVQLWGQNGGICSKAQGRRKHDDTGVNSDWAIMEEWEFSLEDLVPLSQHVVSFNADLPSNLLLVTLNPPGKPFYLPSFHKPPTQPPTPSLGYSSDPELTSKTRPDESASKSTSLHPVEPLSEDTISPRLRSHKGSDVANTPTKGPTYTAKYQQLFELVNLQSLIQDDENTLSEFIQKIDKHFEDDAIFPLRRDVSEQQYILSTLIADSRTVVEETAARKKELEFRRQRLEERKRFLVSARIFEETNLSDAADVMQELEEERDRLQSLRAKFAPTRVGLLSTLASIYPIELDSPPDLLYTILDIPLPIPLTATDPAPPLSLPNHPNVNEETVAIALGYVAQLLQLLAAYLGKTLVYPVTCVGSRSFIKDGISAMVGPRMFPLFSKGVDTYRFEYGVFLLNKDIEMLMFDRDLRALDMRHTLPNLKNLVLTVTHGEVAPPSRQRMPDSPALSTGDLDFPIREEPLNELGSVTPKAKGDLELPDDSTTPPASGSTTPTVTTVDEKKYRPFLGLSFSDFLRGRYPSSSRASVKDVPGGLDGGRPKASSGESDGSEAPEAYGDTVGSTIKASPVELERVPNRRMYDALADGNEESVPGHKVGEGVESESASPC